MWNSIWTRTFGSDIPPLSAGGWLRWLLAAFGFWLVAATRPLWWNFGLFPQVPWLRWGCSVPRQVDVVLMIVAGVGLVICACTQATSRINRISLLAFAGGLFGLMALDQHRCQPWAYQFLLTALILAWAPHDLAIGLLRLLTISLYVHSAISKCDWSFCAGIGQSLLWKLQSLIRGQEIGGVPVEGNYWPLIFPIGEFLIAVGLIWPRTRRVALWCGIGMHLLLLWILGPGGLKHSAGVLIWNLFFIFQNVILFERPRRRLEVPAIEAPPTGSTYRYSRRAAVILTAWVVIWPFGEPWGLCDLWPAWGLYAQHGERLAIFVADSKIEQLPMVWQETSLPAQQDGAKINTWVVRPQQVSLQTTWAPVYPQNRFSLGVALAIARDAGLTGNQISATWSDPANRWTGKQQTRELANLAAIERAADSCWWNARPRR